MGMQYEFNWFLVVGSIEDIQQINLQQFKTTKNEARIYPLESSLLLIIKNIGCIGLVSILNYKVSLAKTQIEFEIVKKFPVNDSIAKHYFELYLNRREH